MKYMTETWKLKWAGGKPHGLKGVAVKRKTVAETDYQESAYGKQLTADNPPFSCFRLMK